MMTREFDINTAVGGDDGSVADWWSEVGGDDGRLVD